MNRSYLFVPADSERKMKKAASAGADALILDLEDSVAAASRPEARDLARDYLGGRGLATKYLYHVAQIAKCRRRHAAFDLAGRTRSK